MTVIFQLFSADDLKMLSTDRLEELRDAITATLIEAQDLEQIDKVTTVMMKAQDFEQTDKKVHYKITDESLNQLRSEYVPEDVIGVLEGIKNKNFMREEAFLNMLVEKLVEKIGEERTSQYKPLIMQHANKQFLRPLQLGVKDKTFLPPYAPQKIKKALDERFREVSQQLNSALSSEDFDFETRFNNTFSIQQDSEEIKQKRLISEWAISCEVNNFEFYYPLLYIKEKAYNKFYDLTNGKRPKGPDSIYSPLNPHHPLYYLFSDLKLE
jgi:hypothetical protein